MTSKNSRSVSLLNGQPNGGDWDLMTLKASESEMPLVPKPANRQTVAVHRPDFIGLAANGPNDVIRPTACGTKLHRLIGDGLWIMPHRSLADQRRFPSRM